MSFNYYRANHPSKAEFTAEVNKHHKKVFIYDKGHSKGHRSVTNDAHSVVHRIIRKHPHCAEYQFFYRDSQGRIDEMVIKDGQFDSFKAHGLEFFPK